MNTYDIIKELSKQKKISIRQLEMKFDYSNGYLAKWKNNTPNSAELVKLADFFDVSVDHLLGRETDYDESLVYYRMNTDELTEEQKEEVRKQIEIAEEIAIRSIRSKK